MSGAQQIYAVIKARSKYNYQQPREGKRAIPFPVTFTKGGGLSDEGYCVLGNGNQYRIGDLNLFVRVTDDRVEWPFVEITNAGGPTT